MKAIEQFKAEVAAYQEETGADWDRAWNFIKITNAELYARVQEEDRAQRAEAVKRANARALELANPAPVKLRPLEIYNAVLSETKGARHCSDDEALKHVSMTHKGLCAVVKANGELHRRRQELVLQNTQRLALEGMTHNAAKEAAEASTKPVVELDYVPTPREEWNNAVNRIAIGSNIPWHEAYNRGVQTHRALYNQARSPEAEGPALRREVETARNRFEVIVKQTAFVRGISPKAALELCKTETHPGLYHEAFPESKLAANRTARDAFERFVEGVYQHAMHTGKPFETAWQEVAESDPGLFNEANSIQASANKSAGDPAMAPAHIRALLGNVRLANEIRAGDWIQLAPKGNHPNGRHIQRVNDETISDVVESFERKAQKEGEHFGGIPIYIGHPDMPEFAKDYPDKKAYGWIMAMQGRPDGLYGLPKWSEAGAQIVSNHHYKYLSPCWLAAEVREGGKLIAEPSEMISIGLTNQPQIMGKPLS